MACWRSLPDVIALRAYSAYQCLSLDSIQSLASVFILERDESFENHFSLFARGAKRALGWRSPSERVSIAGRSRRGGDSFKKRSTEGKQGKHGKRHVLSVLYLYINIHARGENIFIYIYRAGGK